MTHGRMPVGWSGSPKAGSGVSLTLVQPEGSPEPPTLVVAACNRQPAAPSVAWQQRLELPESVGSSWVA